VIRDAGDLHSELAEATVQAETDALTGIGSRLRLSRAIQSAIGDTRAFGLLFLDLKKFKPFNDDHGHETGDRVLQIVARRLQAQVRSDDLAVRFGGDEFVVMFSGLTDTTLLAQRAAAIAASLTRNFHIGDLSSSVGVNIGGAIYPRDGDSEEVLLKMADQNMYRAKQSDIDYFLGDDD
jgi:diguanylate cyclase (GGDEF)-like protein